MKDASFDQATETFRVELRPGQSLGRDRIERAVIAQGNDKGRTYHVRWHVTASSDSYVASRAQAFRAPLLAGGELDVTEQTDRTTVLVFWASWCEPCVAEAPHLERMHARLGERVRFVSVTIDEADAREDLRASVAKLGITYPVALDPGGTTILPKYARGIGIPLTFVIAKDGRVAHVHRNYHPGGEAALEREIEATLK